MSRILIIGNVLKDIYLRLNERHESLESDASNTKWLNWGFNGSSHEFFRRTSVYSGAVVTLEVLEKFGLEASIFRDPSLDSVVPKKPSHSTLPTSNYRYILCAGDQISYLVPTEKYPTALTITEAPAGFDWIFVDRSAILSPKFVENLLKILDSSKKLKLAFYAPKRISRVSEPLLSRAEIVFTDTPLERFSGKTRVCKISETKISLESASVELEPLEKTELFTHLTTYSIIAASVLGALLNNKTDQEALMLAKENIEHTNLDETLPLESLENLAHDEENSAVNLHQMAAQLVGNKKGILAADESGGSIHKKFESMGIPDDFEHRRNYRNLFFTTDGLEKYVNGVILFDETARQLADDGRNFVDFLTAKGIIPGIKVDQGLVNLPGSEEKYTQGLEGLDVRLKEYYKMGLRFAKWRAAFELTETTPTKNAILKNCEILADYASACQKAHIVPIVEPEVVYDGNFPIEKCAGVTGIILRELFEKLKEKEVDLAGTILKVNMVLAGKQYETQSTPAEVGDWTARVLRRFVPKELAGVVFLSGGQTVEQATDNLQEVTNQGPFPWPVTFSYARALQGPALEAWKGDNNNYPEAKAAFKARLKANVKALEKAPR